MVCTKCNARIADTARFCNKCGEKVDKSLGAGDTVTCPECKTAYPKTTRFCKKDGTRLDSGRLEPTAPSEESKDLSSPSMGDDASKSAVELKTAITGNETREEIQPDLSVEPLPKAAEAPQFEPYQQPSAEDSMPKKPKSKMPLILVLLGILGILVLGSGVGGYFYLSKKSTQPAAKAPAPLPAEESKAAPETGKTDGKVVTDELPIPPQPEQRVKPGKLAKLISRDLKHKGLGRIYASVDSKLVVTLKGSANNPGEKARAMSIARMYKEAKEVKDNIHVMEQPKPFTVSPEPKTPTPQPAAPRPVSPAPVKPVAKPQERPRVNDPYLLTAEINQALRNAGLRFVTASVTDNFEIYLMGMVTSSSDREKALRVARSFREGRKVIDQMMNNY